MGRPDLLEPAVRGSGVHPAGAMPGAGRGGEGRPMGLTGDWDERISRLYAAARGRLGDRRVCAPRMRRAVGGGADGGRRLPPGASRRATRRPTASCCGPASHPGALARRRHAPGTRRGACQVAGDAAIPRIVPRRRVRAAGAIPSTPSRRGGSPTPATGIDSSRAGRRAASAARGRRPRRADAQAALRLRLLPEIQERVLRRLRGPRRPGPRPRRAPRRLHLREPEPRGCRCAPTPPCPSSSRSRTTGRVTRSTRPTRTCRPPTRLPVPRHLGRP